MSSNDDVNTFQFQQATIITATLLQQYILWVKIIHFYAKNAKNR